MPALFMSTVIQCQNAPLRPSPSLARRKVRNACNKALRLHAERFACRLYLKAAVLHLGLRAAVHRDVKAVLRQTFCNACADSLRRSCNQCCFSHHSTLPNRTRFSVRRAVLLCCRKNSSLLIKPLLRITTQILPQHTPARRRSRRYTASARASAFPRARPAQDRSGCRRSTCCRTPQC